MLLRIFARTATSSKVRKYMTDRGKSRNNGANTCNWMKLGFRPAAKLNPLFGGAGLQPCIWITLTMGFSH